MSAEQFTGTTFYENLCENQLTGSKCRSCGQVSAPPRQMCPTCHATDMETVTLSGRGTLAAFSVIFIGTSKMIAAGHDRKNPYVSGVVKLEEGPFISGQILGADSAHPETIQIGTPVSAVCIEENNNEHKKVHLGFQI
jgi:uncharacterized OB-fold protein